MNSSQRIGIIDIGSNSIRLVIYERSGHSAYRVVDESKQSARLSEKINNAGILPKVDILSIVQILTHFKMLCEANGATKIRAVATAAIRNAKNSVEIRGVLEQLCGLNIEILSGAEEARLGFLGMANTMDIHEGFLVDIGGGSTEVTLFRNRQIVHSVSFPFGSVNTTKRYSRTGQLQESEMKQIHAMVETALLQEPWIGSLKGIPLIGLGGTIRAVGKLDQRKRKYSLPLAHNYQMPGSAVELLVRELAPMSLEKRKKVDGMSKDRTDIIVPGLLILQSIFRHTESSHYIISGSGLRDGVFYETSFHDEPMIEQVLEHSVRNLLALHPSVPLPHVEQVNRLALKLFDDLQETHRMHSRSKVYLHVASLLYRIGITVLYYDFAKHTFYLMAHSRIDGLTHREILLCAGIASFKTKNRTRQMYSKHKDILTPDDCELIIQLGTLLQLAIALDRSETQPIHQLTAQIEKKQLYLKLKYNRMPSIEMREVESLKREFKKLWDLQLLWCGEFASTL